MSAYIHMPVKLYKDCVVSLIIIASFFGGCAPKPELVEAAPKTVYTSSQEVVVQSIDTIMLSGSLTYAGPDKLVIMVAGSGPTDRNCNSGIGLNSDAFKMVAAALHEQNISSYRYDKRGIGESTKVPESSMKLSDRVVDINAVVNHFSGSFDKIILMGHSEGVLVGSMTAARNSSVAAFVGVAGTSISMDSIILEQFEKYPTAYPLVQRHFSEIKNDQPFSEINPVLQSIFREGIRPFLKEAMELNPSHEISKVEQPVLIISGHCDIQVPVYHAEKLQAACPNAQLELVGGMGHILKSLNEDCSNSRLAYNNPDLKLNDDFVTLLLKFIKGI